MKKEIEYKKSKISKEKEYLKSLIIIAMGNIHIRFIDGKELSDYEKYFVNISSKYGFYNGATYLLNNYKYSKNEKI